MKRAYYLAALAALMLVSLTVLAVQPALGQEEQQGQGQEEPTTGVARVSLVHGDVTSMRGDSGDWVAATVNAPLVRGDKITTGDSSQVEIQLDYANVLRLAPRTEATIADLTRSRIQIQVAQGVANFSVLKGSEAEAEIDTPNMAVRPLAEGAYRIVVNSPTETQLIVRQGQAEVSNPDGSTRVESGRMISVKIEEPANHMTEDARWDYRVTIRYKNSTMATTANPDEERLIRQLWPDQATYQREEQRRFEILLGHWDLPVTDITPSNK